MEIKMFEQKEQIGLRVVEDIKQLLSKKDNPLICVAGGETTIPIMKEIVVATKKGEMVLENAKFISLDEWEGIGRETEGSCAQTLYDNLYQPLRIRDENICFFNGVEHLENEVLRINQFIKENNEIDYIILGVGMNGHVGFNEPGIKQEEGAMIVELDEVTTTVMKKYFKKEFPIKHGVTLSLNQILQAKQIILIITGEHKKEITKKTIEKVKDPNFPVSMLKTENAKINLYVDEKAIVPK